MSAGASAVQKKCYALAVFGKVLGHGVSETAEPCRYGRQRTRPPTGRRNLGTHEDTRCRPRHDVYLLVSALLNGCDNIYFAALVGGQHFKNGTPGVEPLRERNSVLVITSTNITHIASMVFAYTASEHHVSNGSTEDLWRAAHLVQA